MVNIFQEIKVKGFPVTIVFALGKAYFSERLTGKIWQLEDGDKKEIYTVKVIPDIGQSETGLLGIALDPDFEKNSYIYAYYTHGSSLERASNRISRINLDSGEEAIILDDIPAGRIHDGGILAFGPDRKLYCGVGIENDIAQKSQDLNFLGGKVLRVNTDGSLPSDNPFPGSPVYSFGHRNIFGLAFHPKSGKLYLSEPGPDNNDEVNIVKGGGNYGWPEAVGKAKGEKFVDPIQTYTPTITPTQNVFVNDKLYFGSYNNGSIHELTLGNDNFDQVLADKVVYQGEPKGIVGVFYGPEGNFFITRPDKIMQISLLS